MRRKARVDENQAEIVDALRTAGCSVAVTSGAGKGFPDIVVGREGVSYLLEIKDGNKPPSARKLTSDQRKFHKQWSGHIDVVESIEQALEAVGL